MTQSTEDELEGVLEENLCLQDDIKQLEAELAEARKQVAERSQADSEVTSGLAEFLWCMDNRSAGGNRDVEELHKEMRNKGFRYEVLDRSHDPMWRQYGRGGNPYQRYQFRLVHPRDIAPLDYPLTFDPNQKFPP